MSNNVKNNSAIDVIKEYLDNRAKQDPQFAESYAKDNKNLKECFSYIMGEARKRATGNSCCMTSDEVFGLAVHYYDEDDIKISPVNGPTSVKVGNDGSESKADTSKWCGEKSDELIYTEDGLEVCIDCYEDKKFYEETMNGI